MKIYFIRHSEVIRRYQNCYNGHIDIPLSQKGKADAKEVAKKLQNIHFDKAFCSDLLRCRQSIEAFELSCEIIYTDRLREKSWGVHEGKSFDELVAMGLRYTTFQNWIEQLGGEPLESYKSRLEEYFYTVLLKQQANNILVVTHAGVIKMLISIVHGLTLDETFAISLPYSGWLVYDTEVGRFMI